LSVDKDFHRDRGESAEGPPLETGCTGAENKTHTSSGESDGHADTCGKTVPKNYLRKKAHRKEKDRQYRIMKIIQKRNCSREEAERLLNENIACSDVKKKRGKAKKVGKGKTKRKKSSQNIKRGAKKGPKGISKIYSLGGGGWPVSGGLPSLGKKR
jgi:hypothetical protein